MKAAAQNSANGLGLGAPTLFLPLWRLSSGMECLCISQTGKVNRN